MSLQVPVLSQQPRCPVILLLDTSESMGWENSSGDKPIDQLNQGLVTFKKAVEEDDLAALKAEIAILTFGFPVQKLFEDNFVRINSFNPPELKPEGTTLMGEAIEEALELVQTRKSYYKENKFPYLQSLIFLITDGQPDYGGENGKAPALAKTLEIAPVLKDADKSRKLTFFSIGVGNANFDILKMITPPPRQEPHSPPEPDRIIKLAGTASQFRELFLWLAETTKKVSAVRLGQQAAFPSTPNGLQTLTNS
jgi:uncharacterized protein YegL